MNSSEQEKSSSASAISSTTLRPRTRRRTNEADDGLENLSSTSAQTWLDDPTYSSSSRNVSPLPNRARRELPRVRGPRHILKKPGMLGSQTSASSLTAGFWESSWSFIQDFASNLQNNDKSRFSSPSRSLHVDPQTLKANRRRDTGDPPAQWGPSGVTSLMEAGTREDQRAQVQVQKRQNLLAANGYAFQDNLGWFKRKDSDDRIYEPSNKSEHEKSDVLVYVHKVNPEDTLQGVIIKYNCEPNIFRKANRLWPNDSIQVRDTVILPVDACGIKGSKIPEQDISLKLFGEGSTNKTLPTPTAPLASWNKMQEKSEDMETPFSSIPTSPSISVSTSPSEERPWKHDSWVNIDGIAAAVEIARLSRRKLGYFPRSRRKSVTFSDLGTPEVSLDIAREISQNGSPQPATKSWSSSGSYFAHQLTGPGGVGTFAKDVHSPGPGQDGLNKFFTAHLPNVAPRSSFESINSSTSHGHSIDNIGGAVEGWVRRLALKAANSVQPPSTGGGSGNGDLIELSEDAFAIEDDDEVENISRRSTVTDTNSGSRVRAWSTEPQHALEGKVQPGAK